MAGSVRVCRALRVQARGRVCPCGCERVRVSVCTCVCTQPGRGGGSWTSPGGSACACARARPCACPRSCLRACVHAWLGASTADAGEPPGSSQHKLRSGSCHCAKCTAQPGPGWGQRKLKGLKMCLRGGSCKGLGLWCSPDGSTPRGVGGAGSLPQPTVALWGLLAKRRQRGRIRPWRSGWKGLRDGFFFFVGQS